MLTVHFRQQIGKMQCSAKRSVFDLVACHHFLFSLDHAEVACLASSQQLCLLVLRGIFGCDRGFFLASVGRTGSSRHYRETKKVGVGILEGPEG
jgi:hypothetical protein